MKTPCACLLGLAATVAVAGEADVVEVAVSADAGGYHFQVTVRHADEGWEHYADRWEILAPDGSVLATRTLHHPHVNEQPFTRGLGPVAIPADIGQVRVRAHDSVHGHGGSEQRVRLPR